MQIYFASGYYDVNVNKYGIKCGASLRFWENKGWINNIDHYGWFKWYLGNGQVEDQKTIKDKLIDEKNFRGKFVNMIRNNGSKFDDYSIYPKIRQILLPQGYELTEKDFFNELRNYHIKMTYYWFNRQ